MCLQYHKTLMYRQHLQDKVSKQHCYQAGGGQELWDASAGAFNDDVLEDITKKLFDGVDDPVAYVKTFTESQTGAHVVPAPTINAKVGNTTNGFIAHLLLIYRSLRLLERFYFQKISSLAVEFAFSDQTQSSITFHFGRTLFCFYFSLCHFELVEKSQTLFI